MVQAPAAGYVVTTTVRYTDERVGVSTDPVYHLCEEGRVISVTVGGRMYILPQEVAAYRRL